MSGIKSRILEYYENNEIKIDIGFFLAGYVFDAFMVTEVDEPNAIIQQIIYLILIGLILGYKLMIEGGALKVPSRFEKAWAYHPLPLHFFLGTLLNIYSLFFIKSSSLFSSGLFVLLLLFLIIANETKFLKRSKVNLKICWFVVCLFSFFSIMIPVIFGFIGWIPFLTSFFMTAVAIFAFYFAVRVRWVNKSELTAHILYPSFGVLVLLFVFYMMGLLPPVPLAVQKMGIYHEIKKENGQYLVSSEKASWKFWQEGDQDFIAEPGDKVYFFATIFSPARFDDTVLLHWMLKEKQGWRTTDKIPMRLLGGRKSGFRGFSVKEKYEDGDWQVRVETTDGREIGRLYFHITRIQQFNPARTFETQIR